MVVMVTVVVVGVAALAGTGGAGGQELLPGNLEAGSSRPLA